MDTFKDRVVEERTELNNKRKKLIGFIQNNSRFNELSDNHQMLLRLQDNAMAAYSTILRERIILFEREEQEKTTA